jgi:dynein assembly factor 5, axonemal
MTVVPMYKKVYPELLKRMDDANDEVRIDAAATIASMFHSMKAWKEYMTSIHNELDPTGCELTVIDKEGKLVELKLDNVHYESMIKGLFIHMDDTNRKVQVLTINGRNQFAWPFKKALTAACP